MSYLLTRHYVVVQKFTSLTNEPKMKIWLWET